MTGRSRNARLNHSYPLMQRMALWEKVYVEGDTEYSRGTAIHTSEKQVPHA